MVHLRKFNFSHFVPIKDIFSSFYFGSFFVLFFYLLPTCNLKEKKIALEKKMGIVSNRERKFTTAKCHEKESKNLKLYYVSFCMFYLTLCQIL